MDEIKLNTIARATLEKSCRAISPTRSMKRLFRNGKKERLSGKPVHRNSEK